jgi:cobalt/nickel transport system permease protein
MAHSDISAQIDRYAYTNSFAKTSPITKAFFALSTLIISVSAPNPIIPIIAFIVCTSLLLGFAKIKPHFYLDLFIYPTLFVALSCLIIALFFGEGTIIAQLTLPWFTWAIFENGLTTSIYTFFRVEGALSCLFFLVLTTSINDLCITLRRAHIPKILIEMSLLIYRYIFVFLEISTKMSTAQKLRLGHSSWLKKIRSVALLGANLFIRTLEQGERTFIAMNARGYDGNIYVLEELPKPKKLTLLYIALFDVLLITIIILTANTGVV